MTNLPIRPPVLPFFPFRAKKSLENVKKLPYNLAGWKKGCNFALAFRKKDGGRTEIDL